MKPYLELTVAGQFRRLREAAFDACRQFGIEAVSLHPLNHGENTTFRVLDKAGERHVIRIHRPGYQTFNTIDSELRFLEDLAYATNLNIPQPRRTPNGGHIVEVSAKGIEGSRLAAAFNWMDGRFLGKRVSEEDLAATGGLTASLHNFVDGYTLPQGFDRRTWDGEFSLSNAALRLSEFVEPDPFHEACAKVTSHLDGFGKQQEYGLIHADLHFGNVFFTPHGIAAIDFDDLGFAHYAYDYAVTLLTMRRRENFDALCAAYASGYERVRKLPSDWRERLEVFMAARVIFMVDWFFTRDDNPRLRGYRQEFLPKWEEDLKRYVRTGSIVDRPREPAA